MRTNINTKQDNIQVMLRELRHMMNIINADSVLCKEYASFLYKLINCSSLESILKDIDCHIANASKPINSRKYIVSNKFILSFWYLVYSKIVDTINANNAIDNGR